MCKCDWNFDKLKEECGVIGISGADPAELSTLLYFGLISLQHRGQESAGIAVLGEERIQYYKEMGLVQEVFTKETLSRLQGKVGIGHVRYSTTGDSFVQNAQPVVVRYKGGSLALAHNGNLVNAKELRDRLENDGAVFQTSIDTEVIAALIARNYSKGLDIALQESLRACLGAFSLAIVIDGKLVGARDPFGLRPLSIGQRKDGSYVFASETCALDVVGAGFLRDVLPGEIVIVEGNDLRSIRYEERESSSMCSFEYVYFAMPESTIEGRNVFKSRKDAGKRLYRLQPTEADMVMAVPDSGIAAAIGYAEESGIPFDLGMIKNKYMGRTFIQPDQGMRELAVRLKLNVLKENVKGKRIILIDDSIVRGTTMKKLAAMLREAGAKEVHVRVSSPPVIHSCYFGIDTPSRSKLVAAQKSIEEIREMIDADSLVFLTGEALIDAIGLERNQLCTACFDGAYPMDVPEEADKFTFE